MSEELFGLIFAIIWLTGVAVAWFFAFFKGYDKIWSDRIIKFQNNFVFFDLHRRFNKVWHSPFMLKTFLTVFLIFGFFFTDLALCDFNKN